MIIKDNELREFQELYKKYFGEEISASEATDRASKLLSLLKAVVSTKNKAL
ncbi:MAG: hypothetical protein HF312_02590 [Ignavibacteria bacterium]|jgi:hypothetical protein|nr:hypothetical protein [Ignavibacteria bacterium]MCU7519073.1 hypothetical protein [Ignavibacteria bacterium]